MKQKLSKISGYFKIEKLKNDTRIIVFFICLLAATSLWFLNALSKDYYTTISYPVKYINPPKNQFLANHPPSRLELKVNAHGFTLLRYKLNLSFSPIVLNLTNITRNVDSSLDGYKINTNALSQRISGQISNEMELTDILPEVFYIKLDSLKTKKIPVKANIETNFKAQFNLQDSISIHPAKVQITGPAAILDTIMFLNTEKKRFDKLDANLSKTLQILHPQNTTIEPGKALIKIHIEKFTEKEIMIPVQIRNKPENVNIKLFPSEIKLTILVGLSKFENVATSDFEVFVDYENSDKSKDNMEITVLSKATYIKIIRFSPKSVEYLTETI